MGALRGKSVETGLVWRSPSATHLAARSGDGATSIQHVLALRIVSTGKNDIAGVGQVALGKVDGRGVVLLSREGRRVVNGLAVDLEPGTHAEDAVVVGVVEAI